uniref:Uncharacterized protein n=1 Tax=uncultured marine crenarchaeote HF4000_APKG9P22 TaxID=455609 RepID=B3TBK6_9ARCH|nr:hypothetical protein ALOHA_HF4000APKG9P22ctg2g16 [uncultured marine crenarchaeote HF4000_APKG9P22]
MQRPLDCEAISQNYNCSNFSNWRIFDINSNCSSLCRMGQIQLSTDSRNRSSFIRR